MNIIAIIQARIGSTRLPRKVLIELEGKTVLEHVIERVKSSKLIKEVVVATTINKKDLEIIKLCSKIGISVYCGSEENVLDRYYQATRLFKAKHIVRITSDCPLIDPKIIDDVIYLHLHEKSDYTSNTIKETYPDGLDVEVFTFKTLHKAWKNANLPSEKEHVTPYIRKNPCIFKLTNLECMKDLSQKRWTLDYHEDFEFIKAIYSDLYPHNPFFGCQDVLKLLRKKPTLSKINSHLKRNERYKISLERDENNLRENMNN